MPSKRDRLFRRVADAQAKYDLASTQDRPHLRKILTQRKRLLARALRKDLSEI